MNALSMEVWKSGLDSPIYAQVSKHKVVAFWCLLWVDGPWLSGQNSKIQTFFYFYLLLQRGFAQEERK